ncbi:MAG: DMT family transporter [Chloroflexi bacterium]|nr:DMT family transporter [Chloroflexota bacterium]
MAPRYAVALCVLAGVWGASFLLLRVLVTAGMEPLGVSAARTGIGAATLLPFAWRSRARFPRDRRTIVALAALGFANFAVPWTLFGIGQKQVPSGVGSIANSAQPLWAALFSTLLIKGDALGPRRVVGLLLGFAGVVVLMEGRARDFDREALQGIPVMVLATVCYGGSAVSIRRWLGHVPALPLTFSQLGFAFAYLAPLALLTGAYGNASMGWHEWLSLFLLSAGGSGGAIVIYMWLIQGIGPVRAAVVTYMMPPIGIALGWLFLDEPVGWAMLAGLALIIGGVLIVQSMYPWRGVPAFGREGRRLRRLAESDSEMRA